MAAVENIKFTVKVRWIKRKKRGMLSHPAFLNYRLIQLTVQTGRTVSWHSYHWYKED